MSEPILSNVRSLMYLVSDVISCSLVVGLCLVLLH